MRNDVIHNGKIPSRDEVVKYGAAVIDVIEPKMKLLQKKMTDLIRKAVFETMESRMQESDAEIGVTSMGIKTLLNIGIGDPMPTIEPLEDYLKKLSRRRLSLGL
jgi:hypothetical protein